MVRLTGLELNEIGRETSEEGSPPVPSLTSRSYNIISSFRAELPSSKTLLETILSAAEENFECNHPPTTSDCE